MGMGTVCVCLGRRTSTTTTRAGLSAGVTCATRKRLYSPTMTGCRCWWPLGRPQQDITRRRDESRRLETSNGRDGRRGPKTTTGQAKILRVNSPVVSRGRTYPTSRWQTGRTGTRTCTTKPDELNRDHHHHHHRCVTIPFRFVEGRSTWDSSLPVARRSLDGRTRDPAGRRDRTRACRRRAAAYAVDGR